MLPLGTAVPLFVHGVTCKDQLGKPRDKGSAWSVLKHMGKIPAPGEHFSAQPHRNTRGWEHSAGSNPPLGVAHASQVELDGSGIVGSCQFREQICFPSG